MGGCVFPPPNLQFFFNYTPAKLKRKGQRKGWRRSLVTSKLKPSLKASLGSPQQHFNCPEERKYSIFCLLWIGFFKFWISRGSMSAAERTSRQLFPVFLFLCAVKKHKRHLGFSHSHCLCAGCDLHQNRYFSFLSVNSFT